MTDEFVEIAGFDRRRLCDCCQLPTLAAPDEYDSDPQWELIPAACDLCEWESRPFDAKGALRSDSSDEERNDGLTVEEARVNFARFLSIYDPDNPPAWRLTPPSAEVLERRRALRAAYIAVLVHDAPDSTERGEHVQACENALRQSLAGERARNAEIDEPAT